MTSRKRRWLIVCVATLSVAVANTVQAAPRELTPARDLRGVWVSPLAGKAYRLTGRLVQGTATATITENGDIRLRIGQVVGTKVGATTRYTARGTLTFTHTVISESVTVATPKGPVTAPPRTIPADTAATSPVLISVSGTRLHISFGAAWARSVTMQGTFTSDLMRGTMTQPFRGAGLSLTLTGPFNLIRSH